MALYDIFIRTESGDKFKAFTWRGCPVEGVKRARREAAQFGHVVEMVWPVRRKESEQ